MRRFIVIGVFVAALIGCGSEVRQAADDDGSMGAGASGTGGESSLGIDGNYVLAVSTNIAPNLPFIAQATVSGLSADLTWLDGFDRETAVSAVTTVTFDTSGSASPTLDIPGQANAISGSDVQAQVTLTFARTTPTACGTVDGIAIVSGADLPLDGSTFALGPLATATQPVIDCDGNLAGPPPNP
jgi:hypothetical protein